MSGYFKNFFLSSFFCLGGGAICVFSHVLSRAAAWQKAVDHFFAYVVLTLILTADGTLENENELPVEEVCFSVSEAFFLHSAS